MSSSAASPPPPPAPPQADDSAAAGSASDSMLSRRFGKEVVNYYAGSRLNRYSFLRSDAAFLSRAVASPVSRFILLHNLSPLVFASSSNSNNNNSAAPSHPPPTPPQLASFTFDDVKPLIGPDPFARTDRQAIDAFDSHAPGGPLIVFLGAIDEGPGVSADDVAHLDTSAHGVVRAQPFFAVDATPPARAGPEAEAIAAFLERHEARGVSIQTDVRSMTFDFDAASMFAQARSMMDWNARNPFCAGCGSPTLSIEAGYKRVCPPADLHGPPRPDCPTRRGISNLCFPRSDPTMIAAVVSADGQRILLGRQSRYPPRWYSTLAGFLEPGESVEDAVRREVWEEAGVKVGRVVIHSTQPWPYPSTLMLGAIAQALPGHENILLNDNELEAAQWFTLDQVRLALTKTSSMADRAPKGDDDGSLRVPPPQAIANRLMTAVVQGFLTGIPKI
ncbi:hypothetical protein CDD83_8667 [Cordyceps sp. RAO-2017]|nr:hypothetical protein CDD83_8667 [Cordyceps sp. RAO-2017]